MRWFGFFFFNGSLLSCCTSAREGHGGRNHLDLGVEDTEIYYSILLWREFIFRLAPEKKLSFCTDEIYWYFRDFDYAKRNETVCPDLQPRP